MNDSAAASNPTTFDPARLTTCDREPIHIPGSIQPHGALLAFEPSSLRVVYAGGVTEVYFGRAPESLLGQGADAIFSETQLRALKQLAGPERRMTRPLQVFSLEPNGSSPADVVAYQSTGLLVLEVDPRFEAPPENSLALVQAMIRRVQQAESVEAFCQAVAIEVRAATRFGRVMVYRFMRDGSGAVIAESIAPGVESFLGLHYPESDIPKQARALYLNNWIRSIPDATYSPAALLRWSEVALTEPLDMSQSVLRSVSGVHRQYLANMGVVASMSLSIIVGGKLWGLVACHHSEPRYLPFRLREACELFAEMASSNLEAKVAAENFSTQLRSTRVHEELLTRLSHESDLAMGLVRYRPNLLDFIPASGVGLWIGGAFTGFGATPTAEQVEKLVTWLNETAADGVFHSDCLSKLYPGAEPIAATASGLLALSVSTTPRDYVLWFRPEVARTVNWAGDPAKPVEAGPAGQYLTPRKSFAAWQQSVHLHSEPWRKAEIDAAHRLRVSLLEIVLNRIDQLAREREAARVQQEHLMRELDLGLRQWQSVAQSLKEETERRAVAEADLSHVLRRTMEDQEAERLRIARELHDTLGQSLTLLQLGLEDIARSSAGRDGEVQQRITRMKSLMADVGRDINRLAWEIRPTALDDLGLQTAIRHLLEAWSERTQIDFDLHMMLDDRLKPAVETALYRVLQEALTNVVRHANATLVGVILRSAADHVTMIIEDDGKGIVTEPSQSEGKTERLGLLGMRERLSLVGGTFEIESSPGAGTTLLIQVPIQ